LRNLELFLCMRYREHLYLYRVQNRIWRIFLLSLLWGQVFNWH
jgi:hypothetical protein